MGSRDHSIRIQAGIEGMRPAAKMVVKEGSLFFVEETILGCGN